MQPKNKWVFKKKQQIVVNQETSKHINPNLGMIFLKNSHKIQYFVITYNGKESEKRIYNVCVYVYVYVHVCVCNWITVLYTWH